MFAVLSTAWVVPGLLGPGFAAVVAHAFGWRWVFLGLLPLVAVAGPLALPALLHLGRPGTVPKEEHRVLDALRTSGGAAMVLAALDARHLLEAAGLAVAGVLVGGPSLLRLLPAGTLRAARGLPATIASRGLLTFAYFGTDAYVTLTITTVRHHSTVMAGAVVTLSTLGWTAGAWIQARLNGRWEGRRLVRAGLVLILAGTIGMAWQLKAGVPVVEAFVAWSVGSLGMGLAYSPISLMMLHAAPPGREGWASSSLNLTDVLGTAVGVGAGGAAIAAVAHTSRPVAGGVLVAYGVAVLAGVVALVVSRRLPGTVSR
jgi:MFS family permease